MVSHSRLRKGPDVVAVGRGFEPLLTAPKAAVLPLDDPTSCAGTRQAAGPQNFSPPSRAPSASAFTTPWYRYPLRSNTTCVIFFSSAIFAASCADLFAHGHLPLDPGNPPRGPPCPCPTPTTSVLPVVSSTICAYTCRRLRNTVRRGRSGVPESRIRIWCFSRWRFSTLFFVIMTCCPAPFVRPYFAPPAAAALPAFRRITSPSYLIPFPL